MSGSDPGSLVVPSALKPVAKFINQAKKLDKVEPIIAFYCRMYALELAMQYKNRDAESRQFLLQLMDAVEKSKKTIPQLSKDDARMRCETFALHVFSAADTEDRAGKSNKNTAVSFLAAAVFMEITKQFGELSSDIQEKLKYAQWKAVDITKALKEGRQPLPGGIGDDAALEAKMGNSGGLDEDGHYSTGPPAAGGGGGVGQSMYHPAPNLPPPSSSGPMDWGQNGAHSSSSSQLPQTFTPPPTQPALNLPSVYPSQNPEQRVTPAHSGPAFNGAAGSITIVPKPGLDKLNAQLEAERLGKHATSALRFGDVDTAVSKLSEAIAILLPHRERK